MTTTLRAVMKEATIDSEDTKPCYIMLWKAMPKGALYETDWKSQEASGKGRIKG